MFPALFQTRNKTYKATLEKPVTDIILGSGYDMFVNKESFRNLNWLHHFMQKSSYFRVIH